MTSTSKAVFSFVVGAAIGIGVGYVLNTEKNERDEALHKLKDQIDSLKKKLKKEIKDPIEEIAEG